jgi:hypothetical protein
MKKINLFIYVACLFAASMVACKKKLVEEPRSILTADFFKSAQGVLAGAGCCVCGYPFVLGCPGIVYYHSDRH